MAKQTIRDVDWNGKRALVRVDFNVPLDGQRITDDTRIRAALPTIKYLLDHGAAVVLMSHLGRPKNKGVEGLRMERELAELGGILNNPERPFVAIMGGAKISDKIRVITNLLRIVDSLLIGGGMANTFLLAMGYKIGDSLAEPNAVEEVNKILFFAKGRETEILLPTDVVIADAMDANANHKVVAIDSVPDGWRILDIGPETV